MTEDRSNNDVTDGLKNVITGLHSFKKEIGKVVDALVTAVEKVVGEVTNDPGNPTQPTQPPTNPTPPQSDIPSWLQGRGIEQTDRCQATGTVNNTELHCDTKTGHPWTTADGKTDHWIYDQRNGEAKWVHWSDWVA